MEENERRWLDPKHEKLYMVRVAICCNEHQIFFQAEEKEKSWKARCSRSCSHTSLVIEEPYTNETFNKSRFPKVSPICERQWGDIQESSYKLKNSRCPWMESFQETSESERQAVIDAQELAAVLQNEVSQATTACDSLKKPKRKKTYKRGGRTKHKENNKRKLFALLICSSTTATLKELIHLSRHRDPQMATHENKMPMKNASTRKEAEKFEFEHWQCCDVDAVMSVVAWVKRHSTRVPTCMSLWSLLCCSLKAFGQCFCCFYPHCCNRDTSGTSRYRKCECANSWRLNLESWHIIAVSSIKCRQHIWPDTQSKWYRSECCNSRNAWWGRTRAHQSGSNWTAVAKRSYWQRKCTNVNDTTDMFDRHSTPWGQGKFLELEMVSPDCSACNQ